MQVHSQTLKQKRGRIYEEELETALKIIGGENMDETDLAQMILEMASRFENEFAPSKWGNYTPTSRQQDIINKLKELAPRVAQFWD